MTVPLPRWPGGPRALAHGSAAAAALIELLFPSRCAACDRPLAPVAPGQPFCGDCALTLVPLARPCCRCGRPLAGAAAAGPCAGCRRSPPPYLQATAPFLYGGALAQAICRFKYGPRPELGLPLGRLLGRLLLAAGHDLAVPVPLHPRSLRRRGFNQALLLLERARAGRGPKVMRDAMLRLDDGGRQAARSREQRPKRLDRAFAVRDRGPLAGARVLLVDDVLTTGATASACARVLLAAGARTVEVLTLARASP